MDTSSLQPKRLHQYAVRTPDPDVVVITTMKIFELACGSCRRRWEVTNRELRKVASLAEVRCPYCRGGR